MMCVRAVQDVETLTATVDLDEVTSYRASMASLQEQASSTERIPSVEVNFALCGMPEAFLPMRLSDEIAPRRCAQPWQCLLTSRLHGRRFLPRYVHVCRSRSTSSCKVASVQQQRTAAPEERSRHTRSALESVFEQLRHAYRYIPEEEIAYGPAAWMWDYLRRCGACGFLLPLSGGADSSSTAAIVGVMCGMVVDAVNEGDARVRDDALRCARSATLWRFCVCLLKQMVLRLSSQTPNVAEASAWALAVSIGEAHCCACLVVACRIGGYAEGEEVTDAQDLAKRVFTSVFMGTANSSVDTRARSKQLAAEIGCTHVDANIDGAVAAMEALFSTITGALASIPFDNVRVSRPDLVPSCCEVIDKHRSHASRACLRFLCGTLCEAHCSIVRPAGRAPRFASAGGSRAENVALQNIQARLRMVVAFLLAQLLPWVRGRPGFMLVLGSANVDELLRGYLTKYDCSSADINPIGGISKADLRSFLRWAAMHLGYKSLADVEAAPPTAELEPIVEGAPSTPCRTAPPPPV